MFAHTTQHILSELVEQIKTLSEFPVLSMSLSRSVRYAFLSLSQCERPDEKLLESIKNALR